MECCEPHGYEQVFDPKFAESLARRYERRGLTWSSSRIVDFLTSRGLADLTVLEIGGGIGDIQIELLRGGARHTTNLELSPAYEQAAQRLLDRHGLTDRVTRRLLDVAAEPDSVDPADIVVLHRVVCCYPDYERLLRAAGGRAERLLVFSHPPRNLVVRALLVVENTRHRVMRTGFRAYDHPPKAMIHVLEEMGLQPVMRRRGWFWRIEGLERPADADARVGRLSSAETRD